ncbi:MAG TPA: hypothetical protein VL426_01710 [Candidatus Binatia bacterium]|jgi:hypothetical protein|nr:hypothetical protein [Candidatus Binatia bacterium]
MHVRSALTAVAVLSAAALVAALSAYAATTSTNSGATCDKDLWQCSEWGACSGSSRTRVCTLANDCPNVETPKPAEQEACVVGAKGCTADTWSCEDWQPCDARGAQHRDCRMTIDCADVQTVKPVADRLCPTLQCDQPALRDRIACRLRLEPAGIAREDAIRYLPEVCRSVTGLAAQDACVAQQRSLLPCWAKPKFDDRINCAKEVLDLAGILKDKVVACKEMDEPAKDVCLVELRKKVYDLVQFRLSDVEQRALGLRNAGAPFDVAVDLAAAVEEQKVAFRDAKDDDARVNAVKAVRAAWQKFLTGAKPYLR